VLTVVPDREARDWATEKSDAGSATSDFKFDAVLRWLRGSLGTNDDASSIGAIISGAAVGADSATLALGSNDVAFWLGGAMSEVDKLVSAVVPPTDVSTSGAGVIASASVCADGAA
jgi:hypothetical protein